MQYFIEAEFDKNDENKFIGWVLFINGEKIKTDGSREHALGIVEEEMKNFEALKNSQTFGLK